MWKLLGALCIGLATLGSIAVSATAQQSPSGTGQPYHLIVPGITYSAAPTPIPSPSVSNISNAPYVGPIASLDIERAGVSARWTVEERGVTTVGGQQYMQNPSVPDRIAWYPQYGRPGFRSSNTIFVSHVNYVGWSLTPFANLWNLNVGDSVYVTMADGTMYTYTVKTVTLVPVADINMYQVLYPALDNNTEQVTLMTCGGDFFYQPGVGGEYGSRLIVTATRFIP